MRKMTNQSISTLICLIGLCLFGAPSAVCAQVDEDSKALAKRLDGKWAINAQLSQQLLGDGGQLVKVQFDNSGDIAKVPEKVVKKLNQTIFSAGTMKLWTSSEPTKAIEFPFVIIAQNGAPQIVFFKEKKGDRYGNAERAFFMLAVGKDKAQDILFLGGDRPSEAMHAFARAKE